MNGTERNEMNVVGMVEIDSHKNEMWVRLSLGDSKNIVGPRRHFCPGTTIVLRGRIIKYESADGYLDADGDFKSARDRFQLSPVVAISLEVEEPSWKTKNEVKGPGIVL